MLAVRLTPPNKPVENGLELLFPGFMIIVLGLPTTLVGIGLLQDGPKAVHIAVLTDILAIILVTLAFLMVPTPWLLLVVFPFAIDWGAMLVIGRKPVT